MIRKVVLLPIVVVLALSTATAANAANFTWGPDFTITNGSVVLDAFGGTVTCSTTSFSGEIPEFAPALTLSPSYKNCTGFGLPATVEAPEDLYTFTGDGTVHINEPIVIRIYSSSAHTTALCHVNIPAQTPTGKVTYTNNEDGSLTISGSISGIKATQTRTNFLCPAGTETTAGAYTFGAEGIVIKDQTGTVSVHVK